MGSKRSGTPKDYLLHIKITSRVEKRAANKYGTITGA